jgi:vanillate O-demethylase monooxygenase subunit
LRIIDTPIVLFRTREGVAVLQDLCPHRFVPLRLGKVIDSDRIRCAYHGLEFDRHGVCVHNPHTSGRIPAAKAKSYAAAERHGMVWVWLGDATPDPALIPDLSPCDSDGSPPAEGPHYVPTGHPISLVMKANYTLIGDNLLDLSHACVLHDKLLGNIEMADAEIAIDETETGFVVRRLSVDTELPKLFQLMSETGLERGDTWTDMELVGSSCFLNHIGVNRSHAGREGGTGLLGINLLTPIDEETTLYHVDGVLIDPPHRAPEQHAKIGQQMAELAAFAFSQQDQVTLEAQQAAMSDPAADTARPAMFDVDMGSVRFARRVAALLAAEAPH